ncbi:hypothetical protein [Streptantibioticus ferralitis]|uniref:Holin n=1 Tax=Streptantibioticus ferralitis TaxID=236510 RepID=A0ABT5Z007_9ACTN|nr:hypothetical protein [Streptantibioticus ferralitis]MDF2257186.1 hypothetical protein [Streptantibioticus ferralitis]
MGSNKPWWYRIPTRPLGVIVTCGVAAVIILTTPDIGTDGVLCALLSSVCAAFLTGFVQGVAQARHDEHSQQT